MLPLFPFIFSADFNIITVYTCTVSADLCLQPNCICQKKLGDPVVGVLASNEQHLFEIFTTSDTLSEVIATVKVIQ